MVAAAAVVDESGDVMGYYGSESEARVGLQKALRDADPMSQDDAISMLRAGWPGVVLGYVTLSEFGTGRELPFPNRQMVWDLHDRFALGPRRLIAAARAAIGVHRSSASQLADRAVVERVCRELVVDSGHRPCALYDGMTMCLRFLRASDPEAANTFQMLIDGLLWTDLPPEEMPEYLRWNLDRDLLSEGEE